MIKDYERFLIEFDADKDKYSSDECTSIIALTDVYYNCKKGLISRDEAVGKQNDILKGMILE